MSESTAAPLLDDEQRRRAEALREARELLAGRGHLAPNPPEVTDMHAVAVFILDGGDPWTLPLEHPSAESAQGFRYDHDEGRTVPRGVWLRLDEPGERLEVTEDGQSSVYSATVQTPEGLTMSASVVVPESAAYADQLELTEVAQMAVTSMAGGVHRIKIRAQEDPF